MSNNGLFKNYSLLFWMLLTLAVILSLLWPGDHFWGKPGQSITIDLALQANAQKTLASHGISGRVGIVYHPLQVWIYQFFLLLTHDIAAIVFMKSLIIAFFCLTGLFIISKCIEYPPYPILLYFFSPYCFFFSRELCDDTWLIPLSVLMLAAYARFYIKRSFYPLAGIALCILIMVYIHPRGIIPAIPLVITFILFEQRWLRAHRLGAIFLLLCTVGSAIPYLLNIIKQLPVVQATGMDLPAFSSFADFLFLFVSGGMFFSYDMLQLAPKELFNTSYLHPGLLKIMVAFTMISYPLIISGVIFTIAGFLKKYRSKEKLDFEDRLGVLSLFGIIIFAALFGLLKKLPPADYHNGTWFCYFFFIWRTFKEIHNRQGIKLILPVYLLTMAALWLNCVIFNHFYLVGGNVIDTTTVANASQVAKKIAAYSPQSKITLLPSSRELEKQLNSLYDNAQHTFLKFYYQKWFFLLKKRIDVLQRQNSTIFKQSLYLSLRPLVYIYRQKQKNDDLPVRHLVIKKNYGVNQEGLVFIDDPGQVYRAIKEAEAIKSRI